jgi:hypothetical protein
MSQRGFRQCFFVLCKSRKDIQDLLINMSLNTITRQFVQGLGDFRV